MEFAARNMKITLPADHAVDAEIDLGRAKSVAGGAHPLARDADARISPPDERRHASARRRRNRRVATSGGREVPPHPRRHP